MAIMRKIPLTKDLVTKFVRIQTSNFIHSYFTYYRNLFFMDTYSIVGMLSMSLRLTHIDLFWSNIKLYPLNKSKHTVKKHYPVMRSKIIFNKQQLLKVLVKNSCLRGFLKLPTSYITSYYTYLHNKNLSLKNNPYTQFTYWLKFIYKQYSPNYKFTKQTNTKLQRSRRKINWNLKRKSNIFLTKKYLSLKIHLSYKPILFTTSINENLSPRKLNFPIKYDFKYKKSKKQNTPYLRKLGYKSLKNLFYIKYQINQYQVKVKKHNYLQNSTQLKIRKKLNTQWVVTIKYLNQWVMRNNSLFQPASLKSTYVHYSTPFFKSKSFTGLIFRNTGLYVLSKQKWNNHPTPHFKSQFKKKLFSFIYPGVLKKNILLKRKKQFLVRLLSKNTRTIKCLDRFSYTIFNQFLQMRNTITRKNTALKNHLNSNVLGGLNYDNNLPYIYHNFEFNTKGIDKGDLYTYNEVRIPRIRFKPGYQRIWRNVRSALKTALNVKFQYQHQLTKYLVKFYHLSNQYLLSYSESTLDKVLMYSQLLPDLSTVNLFTNNSFVYLNGKVVSCVSYIVIKNDFIQLVVSVWYYIISKWFLNWTNLRVKKFKRLVYKKNKPLQYKIMKKKKTKSYYTPHWIDQMRYDNTDIKPYLEVDFFTLSTFVLSDIYLQYYHKIDDMPDLRNTTYMLYNWKYIT